MQGYHEAFGDRRGTEVDRIEGSMTQRIEKIERERESESEWERGGKGREVAKCGANKRERRKKNRRLKGRITSGILVFAFHLDQSRFPDFPSFRRQEPPLELDVHCTSDETRRDSSSAPTSWRRILSRVRPFNGVSSVTRSMKDSPPNMLDNTCAAVILEFDKTTMKLAENIRSWCSRIRFMRVHEPHRVGKVSSCDEIEKLIISVTNKF